MRTQIYLSNQMLRSPISEYAKITYITLLYNAYTSTQTFSMQSLLELYTPSTAQTLPKNLISKIIKGLEELQQLSYISILSSIDNCLFTIDISPIWLENPTDFTIIEVSDIKKLSSIANIKITKLIPYYCTLVSTINRQTYYGFTSFLKLQEYTKFSSNTVISLNEILVSNNIIGLFKDKEIYQRTNGKFRSETNKYYLMRNKKEAETNIQERKKYKEEQQAWVNQNSEDLKRYGLRRIQQ